MLRMLRCILASVVVASALAVPAGQPVQAAPIGQSAPQDTPVTLVDGGVSSYTLADPKLFWRTGILPCPPSAAGETPEAAGGEAAPADATQLFTQTETVKRIATYGGLIRTVWDEVRACSNGRIQSNLAADADYIYWLQGGQTGGLYRISVEANPGDEPELVNALARAPGEVVDGGDKVYMLYTEVTAPNARKVGYVLKSNKQLVTLSTPGNSARNLSFDGANVYYMVGGALVRLKPGVNSGEAIIPSGVSGYYAEGSRINCGGQFCFFTNSIFVGMGKQIFVYNNNNGTLGSAIYTSNYNDDALIVELVTDNSRLIFLERRDVPCSGDPCFVEHLDVFMRKNRGTGAAVPIHTYGPTFFTDDTNLNTDGSFLYWAEEGDLLRLPNDAAALPVVNLRVTGMEITQGIQDLNNSVLLVKERRTFVRVYVQSDGPSVAGVTARLSSPSFDVFPSLQPVNTTGTQITVRTSPNRNDIEQSFLFELPWHWTEDDNLTLDVVLNPFLVPLEPNYADNTASRNLTFQDSPTLSVEFFRLNYTIGGTTYRPRISEDILRTYSWILRAYPLGGAVGENFKPRLWDVDGGTQLGNWVNTSDGDCADVYDDPDDDIALCASYFTNGWLKYYRIASIFGVLNVGLKTNAFYYGMISDGSNNFPRGQAMYSLTSVGPSGTPCSPFGLGCGWDTDGTYADWYAGHEIGHSLGRAHPKAGSDNPATSGVFELCGHSRSDLSFPYGNTSTASAPIGPASGAMEGFDVGDAAYSIARAVLPSNIWNDLMSYCSNQWISDYTYTAMYNNMIANPSASVGQTAPAPAAAGDFLAVGGGIITGTNSATFNLLRRLDNVTNIPPLVPGDYAIRLLDASDAPLAKYRFTPEALADAPGLGFSQVVTFATGTRTVQIVRDSNDEVLGAAAVSANAPAVSGVALQGAPNPVSGTVTLNWNATDADNDPLSYDVAYSRDNGATFQPIAINVAAKTLDIDTAQLGGSGTAILRVTASDGVNTGYADSAAFVMAPKPPQPSILSPEDDHHIHWGQLVNFNGMALDAQDGVVASSGLVWKNAGGATLGIGPLLSLNDAAQEDYLPVGVNEITLFATNSAGLTSQTSVTVIVDDDLNHPGPTLTVGPTQIGWQVPLSSTVAQTATLLINNAGSGSINWTASADQPWLALNVVSGTVDAAGNAAPLALTANPSGLEGNRTYRANLTITKPADGAQPAQSVIVPVTLSIGDVRNEAPKAPPEGENPVQLPVILR